MIGKEVGHLDDTTLARRFAARSRAETHAHLSEELCVLLGPIVRGGQAHEIGAFVDQIHARERGADDVTDPVQRELIHLFRPLSGEEGVHDLTNGHQLPKPEVGRRNGREDAVGRGRQKSRHGCEATDERASGLVVCAFRTSTSLLLLRDGQRPDLHSMDEDIGRRVDDVRH